MGLMMVAVMPSVNAEDLLRQKHQHKLFMRIAGEEQHSIREVARLPSIITPQLFSIQQLGPGISDVS